MANSYRAGNEATLDEKEARLITRRNAVLGAPYRLFYEHPVHLVRGSGVLLYDVDGQEYLDMYNNVPCVGHANLAVQEAVTSQMRTLNTHTRYLTEAIVSYAERLTALFPAPLEQVVFACSGSEAVDLALRMVRYCTGKRGIIATRHAYHGTTTAAAEASPSFGPNNSIPPWVVLVDAPDSLRDDPATSTSEFQARIEAAIDTLKCRGIGFAGMLLDSVLSSDGLQVQPIGFLRAAAHVVRAHGGLYIADEVQSGFGRVGCHWWGFERHGFVPDLVVLGKPMGNGMPISAVVGDAQVFDAFGRDLRYFNTFGGNQVTVAAANAVLTEIEARQLLPHVRQMGAALQLGLLKLLASSKFAGQIRRAGLYAAIEIVKDDGDLSPDPVYAAYLVNGLRDRRVLISTSGRYANVLKVRPPLVFGDRDLTWFLGAFEEVLSA